MCGTLIQDVIHQVSSISKLTKPIVESFIGQHTSKEPKIHAGDPTKIQNWCRHAKVELRSPPIETRKAAKDKDRILTPARRYHKIRIQDRKTLSTWRFRKGWRSRWVAVLCVISIVIGVDVNHGLVFKLMFSLVAVITHYGEDHDSAYGLDPPCRSGFFFLKKKLRAHSTRVTSLAFSNTLHVLVSAKANNKIFLWSVEEWENLKGRHLLMPAGRNPEVPCDTHIQFHPQ
ncbi:hypothetical protein K1719_023067 [Acacia pycnantha]|nr:hypothetical protein K1719_023067 [Acacia pycnantha]